MPRPKRTTPVSRLTLEMAEPVRQTLEELKDTTQADSLAEVIRKALAVYGYLLQEKRHGGRVVVKKDGDEKEVVFL